MPKELKPFFWNFNQGWEPRIVCSYGQNERDSKIQCENCVQGEPCRKRVRKKKRQEKGREIKRKKKHSGKG